MRPSHPDSPNQSTPQPGAGIVTRGHSASLAAAGNVGTFSDPSAFAFGDNIIWQNRQFYFWVDTTNRLYARRPGLRFDLRLVPGCQWNPELPWRQHRRVRRPGCHRSGGHAGVRSPGYLGTLTSDEPG